MMFEVQSSDRKPPKIPLTPTLSPQMERGRTNDSWRPTPNLTPDLAQGELSASL